MATTYQKKIVLINKAEKKSSYRLLEHDKITYYSPQAQEPEVNTNIKLIWEENGIAAVFKPSNLPMHEGGAYRLNTFSELVKELIGKDYSAVHRLDRETSGIVLCAKTQELRNSLSTALREKGMQKIYYAICNGVPKEDSWLIDQPIGDSTNTKLRTKKAVIANGQSSQTIFKVLDRKKDSALLQVSPLTGRTHQIRVHSAWSGYLLGDKKYQPNEDLYLKYLEHGFHGEITEICRTYRLCLHAGKISFTHPSDKQQKTIDIGLAEDMKNMALPLIKPENT